MKDKTAVIYLDGEPIATTKGFSFPADNVSETFQHYMDGRLPKFPAPTAKWPDIEIQKYEWTRPFRRSSKNDPDEITIRATTLVGGVHWFDQLTIHAHTDNTPVDIAAKQLEMRLRQKIQK